MGKLLFTGLTGFYMLYALDAWGRYLDFRFWWIHAMALVWVIFTLVLFVLEPSVLHRLFGRYAARNPERAFAVMHWAHWRY